MVAHVHYRNWSQYFQLQTPADYPLKCTNLTKSLEFWCAGIKTDMGGCFAAFVCLLVPMEKENTCSKLDCFNYSADLTDQII